MRDRDRPRPRRKKARGSTSRWFQRDENGVPLWAKVGAGVIALMALIGLIIKVVERLGRANSSPSAAVTPAQPTNPPPEQPPPTAAPPKEPTTPTEPPARGRRAEQRVGRGQPGPHRAEGQQAPVLRRNEVMDPTTQFVPLGDQAVLAYLANEAAAVRFAAAVRAANPAWLFDVVPAYASVGVFFDADQIGMAEVLRWLDALPADKPSFANRQSPITNHQFTIPVCYEFAPDLPRVCEHTHLTADEFIRLHTATEFAVYAVGFVPGFPYMGYLPSELCGVGRLPSPRVRVEPGSVAITGRQTAIYPRASPGGWNLIGRTPLVIVDVKDGFFPLRVGDRVRFARIDETRYAELEGERLAPANGHA